MNRAYRRPTAMPRGNVIRPIAPLAIAAHELLGLPTWATISSTIMESFAPPAGVRRLTIFADNDTNFAGQVAAITLARHLHNVHRGLAIEVKIPPVPDSDWLDVLNVVGVCEP